MIPAGTGICCSKLQLQQGLQCLKVVHPMGPIILVVPPYARPWVSQLQTVKQPAAPVDSLHKPKLAIKQQAIEEPVVQ